MPKEQKAFRTISEVAQLLGTKAHVLRYWEAQFKSIRPVQRPGGRRYYRPEDIELIGAIKQLLHDKNMTIKQVQKLINSKGMRHVIEMTHTIADTEIPTQTVAPSPSTDISPPPLCESAPRAEPQQFALFPDLKPEAPPVAITPPPALSAYQNIQTPLYDILNLSPEQRQKLIQVSDQKIENLRRLCRGA